MVFGLLGVLMVLIGIAGNALYQIGDAQLAGTVFEEGAWIYVCYGAVLAALGGVTYWGPKLWGRTIDDKKVLPLALLGFARHRAASLPYYVAGFAKQPAGVSAVRLRRSAGPVERARRLPATSLMVLTVLAFVGLAVTSFRTGPRRR